MAWRKRRKEAEKSFPEGEKGSRGKGGRNICYRPCTIYCYGITEGVGVEGVRGSPYNLSTPPMSKRRSNHVCFCAQNAFSAEDLGIGWEQKVRLLLPGAEALCLQLLQSSRARSVGGWGGEGEEGLAQYPREGKEAGLCLAKRERGRHMTPLLPSLRRFPLFNRSKMFPFLPSAGRYGLGKRREGTILNMRCRFSPS